MEILEMPLKAPETALEDTQMAYPSPTPALATESLLCSSTALTGASVDPIRPPWYLLPPNCMELADITFSLPHARACAIEYLYRAGRKDPSREIEDLKKARRWIDLEIEHLQQQQQGEEL